MIDALIGGLWPYILAAGGVVVAFVGAYLRGRKDGTSKAENKQAKDYIATRKDMDDADIPTHGADVDRWLRERAKRERGL
mgnify:CR=1 FL=1